MPRPCPMQVLQHSMGTLWCRHLQWCCLLALLSADGETAAATLTSSHHIVLPFAPSGWTTSISASMGCVLSAHADTGPVQLAGSLSASPEI